MDPAPVESSGEVTDPSLDRHCPDQSEPGWGSTEGQDHERGNRDQGGPSCNGEAQSRMVRAEMEETEARAIRAGRVKSGL